MKIQSLTLKSQTLLLHPGRAIFWKEENALILSDLHLGKAGHFRKNGIPIPEHIHNNDLAKISVLIKEFNPKKILIVGDLFHSSFNNQWKNFETFVKSYSGIDFFLIKGNHDILDDNIYAQSLHCYDRLELGPFSFVHKPANDVSGAYLISGHIHPSVTVNAGGRQSIRLPCFYFSNSFAVLPSFGNFTGNYKISFKFEDLVYLIVDDQVVPYNPVFYHD